MGALERARRRNKMREKKENIVIGESQQVGTYRTGRLIGRLEVQRRFFHGPLSLPVAHFSMIRVKTAAAVILRVDIDILLCNWVFNTG